MMTRRSLPALLIACWLLAAAALFDHHAALAQAPESPATPVEAPQDPTAEQEDAGQDADEDESDVAGADTPPDEADPAVNASLERFVPSEQISEDNSVAYPNDI